MPQTCPGCGARYLSAVGESPWCDDCRLAKTITIDLTATELRKLEAIATIRGSSILGIIRQAIDALSSPRRELVLPEAPQQAESPLSPEMI